MEPTAFAEQEQVGDFELRSGMGNSATTRQWVPFTMGREAGMARISDLPQPLLLTISRTVDASLHNQRC